MADIKLLPCPFCGNNEEQSYKFRTVTYKKDRKKVHGIYHEIFELVEKRAGVSLSTRLTNKRNRMAREGICKSKRDKLTKVDIIAKDKKLIEIYIEIYIAIIKEMAVKYGIC